MIMNWNVSTGDLLTMIVMITAFWGFHMKNVERFAKIELKVDTMWKTFKSTFHINDEGEE